MSEKFMWSVHAVAGALVECVLLFYSFVSEFTREIAVSYAVSITHVLYRIGS